MEDMWSRCLMLGIDVILDGGFWSRAERDRVRTHVAELGGRTLLYHLACPEDVARRRVTERNLNADGLYIAPATFDALKARFEPLSPDEERVEINGMKGRAVDV